MGQRQTHYMKIIRTTTTTEELFVNVHTTGAIENNRKLLIDFAESEGNYETISNETEFAIETSPINVLDSHTLKELKQILKDRNATRQPTLEVDEWFENTGTSEGILRNEDAA